MMSTGIVNFIQISDIHLNADRHKDLLGVKTQESFQAVIDHIESKKHQFEFIILSGDLTQDGSEAAYRRLADMLGHFNVPIYCFPGNHDDANVMNRVYPLGNIQQQKQIILNGWQLILLDSHVHSKVEGYLAQDQLRYMQTCLQSHPDLQAVVMFHHQPVPVGCAWLDNLGVKNAAEFWDVAAGYSQITHVLFGHVHQEFEQRVGNIQVYSPPSTCIQFMRNRDDFALEHLTPGYRVVRLHPNGKMETHIERVAQYVGYFDKDAKGY